MSRAFTLIEMLLVLFLTTVLLILIQPIIHVISPEQMERNQRLSIFDFQQRVLFAQTYTIESADLLIVDEVAYHCKNNSLYVTPGYQPLLFDLECSFEYDGHYYLVTPLGRFILD